MTFELSLSSSLESDVGVIHDDHRLLTLLRLLFHWFSNGCRFGHLFGFGWFGE